METMPKPHSISGNELFSFIWNSPNYAFKGILFLVVVTQIMWLIFVSSTQRDWAVFMVIVLHVSAYISGTISRENSIIIKQAFKNLQIISVSQKMEDFKNIRTRLLCDYVYYVYD
ncbi:hypothetical protein NPIL_538451 [Nephila pilipes]|uniref:Uncharacterized protein n=1 Tax=Nephila pilipes TaxID=299642 RepID=A0A8X6TU59_NEPPI|nr:hypothetical protein NPIL_538451 [Nephila pilipes]